MNKAIRRTVVILFALLPLSTWAGAQIPTSGNVFFGYSFERTGSLGGYNVNLNGWNASLEGKVLPFIGLVADFGSHYGSTATVYPPCPIPSSCVVGLGHVSQYDFLFGPRASFSVGKIRPFAEALFGASHINTDLAGPDTGFSYALGGGADVKIIRPLAWRFEGDYVQTRLFGNTENNGRFSTGIVFRF